MSESIIVIAAAAIATIAILPVAFLVGMRTKSPLVMRPIIALSRRFMNPAQMRSAGRPGAYASIIRHRGRRSGRPYETPIGAVAIDDGFLIALPYGTHAQWLRNVLSAGSATLVTEGHTYEVDHPELVPMGEVLDRFPPGDRKSFRLFAVDRALRLHRTAEVAA